MPTVHYLSISDGQSPSRRRRQDNLAVRRQSHSLLREKVAETLGRVSQPVQPDQCVLVPKFFLSRSQADHLEILGGLVLDSGESAQLVCFYDFIARVGSCHWFGGCLVVSLILF